MVVAHIERGRASNHTLLHTMVLYSFRSFFDHCTSR